MSKRKTAFRIYMQDGEPWFAQSERDSDFVVMFENVRLAHAFLFASFNRTPNPPISLEDSLSKGYIKVIEEPFEAHRYDGYKGLLELFGNRKTTSQLTKGMIFSKVIKPSLWRRVCSKFW